MLTPIPTFHLSAVPVQVYQDTVTKREYVKVVGGFAWPSVKPGCAVVLGMGRATNPQTHRKDVWILAQEESLLVEDLLGRMSLWQKDYCCAKWYGDTESSSMTLLRRYNKNREKTKVRLAKAHKVGESDALHYYAGHIRALTASENKVLQFGKSFLRERIMEMGREDVAKAKVEDFPAVAALGYALSGMEVFERTAAKPGKYQAFDKVFGY